MSEPTAPVEPSRRSRKKERTRRAIYDAAMELFAERSFDAVRVEDICARADVAKATFFLHFPTKASLLFEAVAQLSEDLREQLVEPLPTAREELQRITRWVLARWAAQREVMEPMFREILSAPAAQLHARPEAMDFAGLIVDIVRRGQARGELRRDVLPEIAATSFVASCFTIVSVLVRQDPRADIAPFIEQYLELLLHGLTPRTPAPA